MIILIASVLAFTITYIFLKWSIPKLKNEGIIGKDVNKPNRPEVAEMGGLGVLLGVVLALSLITALDSKFDVRIIVFIYSILLTGLIGIIDDILSLPKWAKFLLPIIGSIPLIIYGSLVDTKIGIPFIGMVDFGIFYVILILPIMYTGAANLTNILAGFNGLEYSLALINYLFLFIMGIIYGKDLIILLSSTMFASSLAFLLFNRYPSKVFPGDTGTLIIGGSIVSMLVLDNFESLAIPIFILYGLDGIIKILNGLPSTGWWGEYKDGKLYVNKKPISLAQTIMYLTKGISEQKLVDILIIAQLLILTSWTVLMFIFKTSIV